MSKSKLVHLKNKYPHCYVGLTGNCLEVIGEDNELIVSLEKSAHGEFQDRQHEVGARDAYCQAPIPREARCWKLDKDGKVKKDQKHDERKAGAAQLIAEHGKIPSIKELEDADLWDSREEKSKRKPE